MRRYILHSLFLLLYMSCFAQDQPAYTAWGLSKNDYKKLSGVWVQEYKPNLEVIRFSWGIGKAVTDASTIIDLAADPPYYAEPGARFTVLSVKKKSTDTFLLNLKFISNEHGWTARRTVHINRDGSVWFEGVGKTHTYHKISGPSIPLYGICNDTRVRIRKEPELNSEILGHLDINEKITLLDRTDEKMRIREMNSYWYKVKTGKNITGWAYGFFIDIK